jgi:hypothetical protein
MKPHDEHVKTTITTSAVSARLFNFIVSHSLLWAVYIASVTAGLKKLRDITRSLDKICCNSIRRRFAIVMRRRFILLSMQPIYTHKIGRHSSKPSHAYPVIRLPREFKAIVGRNAHVYQTQNDGKLVFLVTVDEKVGNFVATDNVDNRISELESKTDTIIKFLEANNPEIALY